MNTRRLLPFLLAPMLFAADPAIDLAKKKVEQQKFDEAISGLEAAHKTKPKSADLTKALTDTYLSKADSLMNNPSLPPREKYPNALRAYRRAFELDNTSKRAKQGVDTIEGVYKSMGRPIPQ